MSEKKEELCKNLFTEEEIKHLEEVLMGDLDEYYKEVIGITDEEFEKWKESSNSILGKCGCNIWEKPEV